MDKIIRAENLIFDYKQNEEKKLSSRLAINDISFEIEEKTFVAIIGKNGSGKSTLAKNINALLIPSGGTMWVDGYDTKDDTLIWNIRKSAGMVFQNPDNQLVSAIVEDDVAFGPENLGIESGLIRERVDEALKAVNMYEFRKKAPHLLSGGQKQRIAIAGVLAMRPKCIVFDEPTSMLDPKGRSEVMEIINTLNKEGITTVLITHFMEEALKADKIIIMEDGKIRMEGTPKEVFARKDEIRQMNLDIPMSVEMADLLRKKGIDVPLDIVTEEQLYEYIMTYN